MRFIVLTLDRRVFDSAIHSLDLTVRPRVVGLRQPMLDAVFFTDTVEQMLESPFIFEWTRQPSRAWLMQPFGHMGLGAKALQRRLISVARDLW